VPPDTSELAPP